MSQGPVIFAYLDEPPFCYPGKGGGAEGSDVELVAATLAALGISTFEARLATFAELLPGLASGRWAITTPLFITPERRTIVDFSRPVWALADGFLVREREQGRLNGYQAVASANARLVVVGGQVQEQTALGAGITPDKVLRVATQEEAVRAVSDGHADAYASVAQAHRGYLARRPDPSLAIVTASDGAPASGAFAFGKASAALRRRFDDALAELIGSEWHRAMMARHGFGAAEY